MYDPIELSKKIEKLVIKNNFKKYYRFRPTGFYGGIATADTVGCNLRCKFCWSSNSVWNTRNTGQFYSSEEVAIKLQKIADEKGYNQLRVSGGEPTIGKQHLIDLLKNIKSKFLFILETNGILLGYNKNYTEELSTFKNLHVRVCFKGADNEEFSLLTGAKKVGFDYQIKSLDYLNDNNISFNIAIVSKNEEKKNDFFQRFSDMNLDKIMIEDEEIKLYPNVIKRLQKEKLLSYFK
jgi:uncharacterized Fe-S cluster-containing radical SAM superfamily protein